MMRKWMLTISALVFWGAAGILPSYAAGVADILLNGSDGVYWGMSRTETEARAQGEFVSEKKMGGFAGLVYAGTLKKMPVETTYTLKDDQCWKITISVKTGSREALEKLFEETVAALAKTMDEDPAREEIPDISLSADWKGGETGASVYCNFADGRSELSISYESTALAKAIWGKLAG